MITSAFAAFDEKGIIHFPAGQPAQLRVKVVNGLIDRIEAGDGFTEEDFEALLDTVHRRLGDSSRSVVGRAILHSSRAIEGYRFDQDLGVQLAPVPAQAPRPRVVMADHPFIIETQLSQGGDAFITNERMLCAAIEWGLVLNAALRMTIVVPDPRTRHVWVYDNEARRSRWLQAWYFTDEFERQTQGFAKGNGRLIELYPHEEYYESEVTPGAERDVATLPESIGRILGSFRALSAADRSTYLRAARWVQVASTVWDLTASSWVTALVSAIETLVPTSSQRCSQRGSILGVDRCEKCGSMIGVSRAFRDFVERYSPRCDHKIRQAIYNLRSRISHGSMLLAIDEAPWAFGATFEPEHRKTMEYLLRIAREIMVNWLGILIDIPQYRRARRQRRSDRSAITSFGQAPRSFPQNALEQS